MLLKEINKRLKAYDTNLYAVIVEGWTESESGIKYKDRGVQVRSSEKGDDYVVVEFFKDEAKPDFILTIIKGMDKYKGTGKHYKDIKGKNEEVRQKKDEKFRELINDINKDVVSHAISPKLYFNT